VITRGVIINVATNYGAKILSLGVGFVLTPFILREVGPVGYGLWALAASLVGYGALLDLGIGGGVIKFVAELQAREDWTGMTRLVTTALATYSALGLVTLALTSIAVAVLPAFFHIAPTEVPTARWVVLLMGITLALDFPAGLTSALLRGLQRFDRVNLLSATSTLLSAVSTVTVLLLGGGLIGMVAIGVPLTILMQVPALLMVRRVAPAVAVARHAISLAEARHLLRFSWSLFIMQTGGRLQTETDLLIIARFLPITAVAPYAIALRLANIPQILTDQFLKVLLPLSSALHASNDRESLRELYVMSSRLTLSLLLPVALPITVLARPILSLWVGALYVPAAPLTVILLAASLIVTSQWPAGSIMQGMARHRFLAYSALATGITNLLFSIALVHLFGSRGVALGTLIPTTVESLCIVLPYTMHTLGIGVSELLREVVLPVGMPALPAIGFLMLANALVPLNTWIALGGTTITVALLYVGCYLSIGARGEERTRYVQLARATLRLARGRRA
jgi:O-antigen/teichoic acid export membrane protein